MHLRNGFLIGLLIFLPALLPAQDITGLWKGYIHNDTTGKNLRYEVAISEFKGKLSGYSHTFFIVDDKEYFGVKRIKVKREDDKIIIQEVELISNNYPIPPAKGVHQLDVLTLEMRDSLMVLTGPFTTNRTKEYHSLTGSVYVERKLNYRQSALIPHLEELGLSKDVSFLKPEEETLPELNNIAEPVIYAIPVNAITKNSNDKLIANDGKVFDVNIKADTPKAVVAVKPKPVDNNTVAVQTPPKPKQPATSNAQPATQPVAVAKPKPVPVTTTPVATPVATPAAPVSSQPVAVTPAPQPKPAPVPQNVIAPVSKDVATEVGSRTIQTIQSVYFKSDSLQLTLYDNGEVDGDTVSVLMNGQVIMPKVGLSTKAYRKTIYITPDMPDSIQLIMYAENLGSIPPNTGLLVVHDGEDTYEIRFSGDYKKNAAIVFRRRK